MTERIKTVFQETSDRVIKALHGNYAETGINLFAEDACWIVVSPGRYRNLYRDKDARAHQLVTIAPGDGLMRIGGMIVREDPALADEDVRLRSEVLG